MDKIKKFIPLLVILFISIIYFVGYQIGKNSVKPIIKTVYETGPSIGNIITNLDPIKVDIPKLPLIIFCTDTITNDSIIYIPQYIDSLEIIKDYYSKRYYNNTLFDIDTLGRCDINAIVYQNKLTYLDYTFTPIRKITTKLYQEPKFELFLGTGINTGREWNLQGGIFKNHFGLSYQFTRNYSFNDNFHGINVFYKFNFK